MVQQAIRHGMIYRKLTFGVLRKSSMSFQIEQFNAVCEMTVFPISILLDKVFIEHTFLIIKDILDYWEMS